MAAEKLRDLRPEVVFLGGAVVSLLRAEAGGLPPRATKDVDVAIEVSGGIVDVYALDRRLLDLGFQNDTRGPTCRYLHGPTVLDVIPVNPDRLGEVNTWYPLAIETARAHTLGNDLDIRVIAPVPFLGTKLKAFRSPVREHHGDVFLSRDFGDVVTVVDGRPEIADEVREAREDLAGYVCEQFAALLNEQYIEEAVIEHVDPRREEIVLRRMRALLS